MLELGRTVQITALKSPRGALSFLGGVKSPIHSPRQTCIVCQMSPKIYALVKHFSKNNFAYNGLGGFIRLCKGRAAGGISLCKFIGIVNLVLRFTIKSL